MNYYTRERLGPKQALTPEGFLLCSDVPIARTGTMLYGYGEVSTEDGTPLEVDGDRVTYVDRAAEDVFRAETLASFDGKPLVNSHPEDDVGPHNWRQLAAGTVMRVRRGAGVLDDVMLADVLVTNHDEIQAVRAGLREVSCGYTAKYQRTAPARYRQYDIIGNHVALVESGRCGSRCSIGDTISNEEKRMTVKERFRAAFKSKDEAAFDAVLAEVPAEGSNNGGPEIHIHNEHRPTRDAEHKEDCDCAECKGKTKDRTMDARMKKVEDSVDSIGRDVKSMKDAWEKKDKEDEEEEDEKETKDNTAIEGSLEMEAPPGTDDGVAAKAKDSAYLADSWEEAISLGEIISPGYRAPTFDAKSDPKKTFDSLCRFRRSVLDLAEKEPATRSFMESVTAGREWKTYDCNGMRTLFRAVGAHKKDANNRSQQTADERPLQAVGGGLGTKMYPEDINKKNADFWSKQPA